MYKEYFYYLKIDRNGGMKTELSYIENLELIK